MKRFYFFLVLTLTLALAIPAFAGNGLPEGATGKHYNLNIIGVSKTKTADMDNNQGHRIFVKLTGKTKILLAEGDFEVLDANGTDGEAAFQLPNPDPENDGITAYSVFARALGKPGGTATMTTCLDDGTTEYCSIYQVVFVRAKGKSHFTNVSKQLLYVYANVDGVGGVERYPLFSDSYDYFWDYTNTGLKHAQLRFYPMSTNVN